jgi:hypothetical protein
MPRQWLRTAASRVGIRLPFTSVVCTAGTRTISLDADGRVQVSTKQTLVFLEQPTAGDLCDTYALSPGERVDSVSYNSPDAFEITRERTHPGRVTVYWRPGAPPIAPYTLYVHQCDWTPAATLAGSAVCIEYQADVRTGVFAIELVGPEPFEAAVFFKRPRWPRLTNERRIVSYALRWLKEGREQTRIDGNKVVCDVHGPQVGDRYMVVAFRKFGVVDLEERLKESSIVGRARRLAASWAQAVTG